mgnify:CR=1 FL=1
MKFDIALGFGFVLLSFATALNAVMAFERNTTLSIVVGIVSVVVTVFNLYTVYGITKSILRKMGH